MPKIFVSYSRSDKAKVKLLIPLLRGDYGLDNIWWDEDFVGGQPWWEEILRQIAQCDVFVYLMSPLSLGSPYCQAELQEARRLHKPILPVKLRRDTNVPDILARMQYINLAGAVNRATMAPLRRAINEYASRPPSALPPSSPNPVAMPQIPPREPRNLLAEYGAQLAIGIVVTIIGGLILAMVLQQPPISPASPTPTPPSVVINPPVIDNDTAVPLDPLQIAAATQTQDALDFAQTLAALDAAAAAAERETATAFAPKQAAQVLATVDAINTATRAAIYAQQTQSAAQTLTAMPTPDPLAFARIPVTRNADWTPVTQEFNGVPMMLVPAGCFMMGSNDGNNDEQPVHEQCFDAPFWIDRTEVTQADFERLGGSKANANGFDGDQRPVERITWFEARDFCASRGARLPTEREWEYAARGPDNLVYPWGNSWNENNAVFAGNSNNQTANIGSRPAGASWVGALDMSGNVWEWVSSLYQSYEYDAADGREAATSDRTDVLRVLRGGSWDGNNTTYLRSANRNRVSTGIRFGNFLGFRCARSS